MMEYLSFLIAKTSLLPLIKLIIMLLNEKHIKCKTCDVYEENHLCLLPFDDWGKLPISSIKFAKIFLLLYHKLSINEKGRKGNL